MLQILNLKKSFDKENAINGLNMCVQTGSVYGLVGPNGSGKTTLMRICMGLLSPDSGSIKLYGYNALENMNYLHETVGYMPDFFGVYDQISVIEYMEFYGALYGMSKQLNNYWMELLDLVNLSDKAECMVDTLSKGMKQRLGIARCLVHNPILLMLDEPSSGLDPLGKKEIIKVIRNLKQSGKTVIISSDVLTGIEEISTHIGIIKDGVMMAEGTVDEVVNKMNNSSPISITVLEYLPEAIAILKKNENVTRISVAENKLIIGFNGTKEEEAHVLSELVEGGVRILNFSRVTGNLENIFFEITQDAEGKKEKYENKSSLFERFKIKR